MFFLQPSRFFRRKAPLPASCREGEVTCCSRRLRLAAMGRDACSSALLAVFLASVATCSSMDGSLDARAAFVPPTVLRRGDAAGSFLQRRPPPFRAATARPLRAAAGVPTFGPGRALTCARWVCQVGGGFMEDPEAWGDDDMFSEGGDEGADWRTVLLKDMKLGRTIECFVDREIEVEGKQYATLMPADTPVIMAGYKMVNGSQQLVPVLEDKAIDDLFPTAFAVLSEMELTLSRSAVVLTVPQSSLALRRRVRKRRQPHGAE
jgi:hypothetical protein